MDITIRNYNPITDYEWVKKLYMDSSTYGWQYDDARDTSIKLESLVKDEPNKILIAEISSHIVGTLTLFEDGRAAWLYRFAVQSEYEQEITKALFDHGKSLLKEMWHTQVLVYAPSWDSHFEQRYTNLWMNKWNDFTAYWTDI